MQLSDRPDPSYPMHACPAGDDHAHKGAPTLEARVAAVPPPSRCLSRECCLHACMLGLPQKLMVSLAECNFYGALGIVRQAIQNADEPGGSWDG